MCGDRYVPPDNRHASYNYNSTPPKRPEDKLAELMRADLGTTCSARELRMFIKANWRAVTAYAHAIHDGEVE